MSENASRQGANGVTTVQPHGLRGGRDGFEAHVSEAHRSQRWREIPSQVAMALLPIAIVVAVWNPCDTAPSVAVGDSLASIGLNLAVAVCAALGCALGDRRSRNAISLAAPKAGWPRAEHALLGLVVAFCIWLAVATWFSIGRGNARFAINGCWQWLSLLGIAASVFALSRRPGMVWRTSVMILAVLAGLTAYGWMEYAWIQPDMRAEFARDPVGALQRRGIVADSAEALLIKNRIESTEMRGVYALANSLAGVLVVAWVLVVGWAFTEWQRLVSRSGKTHAGSETPHQKGSDAKRADLAVVWALVAMAASVGMALLLTKSRTAWIAAILATPCVGLLHPNVRGRARRWLWLQRGWVALAGGLCIGIVLVVYWLDPLIIREAPKSLAYRMDYWRGAWELINAQPALGYGPLNYQSTYLRVKLPTAAESPADPHNAPLEIAHAGGWPLLLFAVAFLLVAIRLGRSRMRRADAVAAATEAAAPMLSADRASTTPTQARETASTQSIAVCRRDVWAFWSGAALAATGVFLWSFFRAGDLELGATCVGLFAALTVVFVCARWGVARVAVGCFLESDLSVFAVALGAFGIHLLASGGWMLPGTMMVPMVLLGLWLSDAIRGQASLAAADAWAPSGLRVGGGWMVAGCAAALWGLWWWTMFSPVTQSMQRQLEWTQTSASWTPDQIVAAVQVDPYDAELARVGLELATSQFEQARSETSRRAWEQTVLRLRETFLSRDPGHALALSEVGQKELRIAAAIQDPSLQGPWLERAAEDFVAAAKAYPASAQACLQASVACGLAGREQDSMPFAQAADRIDAATPHRDRKLQAVQVFWPRRLQRTGIFAVLPPLEGAARRGIPEDFVRGEPVAEVLRSHFQPAVRE